MDRDLSTRRRTVLLGGAGALAAAFLAACSDEEPAETGATAPSTTAPPAADPKTDLQLSRTFASLELLAIDTYQSILDAGHVTTVELVEALKLFQQHHQTQLDTMNNEVVSGGDKEITAQNAAAYAELVKPKLDAATTEAAVVALLTELEQALAQTYTWSCGTEGFTTTDLRKTATTIAGIDARHTAVLQIVFSGDTPASIFPASGFYPATNPIADIDGAMLTE